MAVCGDFNHQGDMPMEFLQAHSYLPVGEESHVTFTLQSKNKLYVGFENAILRNVGDTMRFSYFTDHPMTAESEEHLRRLLRECRGDGEYVSVHHPNKPNAKGDASDATAFLLMASAVGGVGDILFL